MRFLRGCVESQRFNLPRSLSNVLLTLLHGGLHGDFQEKHVDTRSPSRALLPLFEGKVPLLKSTTEKSWYPYAKLSNLEDVSVTCASVRSWRIPPP